MSKYTNYILLLIVVDGFGLAYGSIEIFNEKNTTIVTYDSYSASFGPSVPDNGFEGYIALGKPLNGCQPMEAPPNISYVDPKHWIALVVRTPSLFGNCSFDLKVYHAQRAGYAAVIIYNSDSDDLIKMSSAGAYTILIPSVFVGHSTGLELAHYYTYVNKTYAVIYNEDDINYLLIPFISVVSICFLIAICIFLTKLALHCHKVRKNRFPKSELKKIPTKKYTKSDKYDTCPICLNEYEEGVKIRILPCEHAYHVECIDKWLLRNNRLCPVCKRRVIPGGSDSDSSDEGASTSTTADHSRLIETAATATDAATATAATAATTSRMVVVAEQEPNEDDDTNESSRLLVTTTTAATRNNSDDQPISVSVLNEIISNTGTAGSGGAGGGGVAEISSLNNQMLMTTSIGSGTSAATTGGGQLFLMQATNNNPSNNPMLMSANNSIMSKYGSISSMNQVASTNTAAATSSSSTTKNTAVNAATVVSSSQHQYDNLIYQDDDDDDELLDVATAPTTDLKTSGSINNDDDAIEIRPSTSSSSPPKPTNTSAAALAEDKLSPPIEDYHSPVSIADVASGLEERISNAAAMSSKLVDEDTELKQPKSVVNQKRPSKKQLKQKKSHSQSSSKSAAPLAVDISKIAAKLEQENKRQKTTSDAKQQQQQSKDDVEDEHFLSVDEDDKNENNDSNSKL